MYYGTDENGHIVMGGSDILPEEFESLYPFLDSEDLTGEDLTGEDLTGEDLTGEDLTGEDLTGEDLTGEDLTGEDLTGYVSGGDMVTYDQLVDLFSNIPSYTVFPSSAAVNVFSDVVQSIDGKFGYVVLSGADSSDTYLYYSKDFSVSGSTIVLNSPVTVCRYYQYRPTTSGSYVYTYTVGSIGQSTFNITNQLVYTNLLDGYPDLLPYKNNESYLLLLVCAISLLITALGSFFGRFKSRREENNNG